MASLTRIFPTTTTTPITRQLASQNMWQTAWGAAFINLVLYNLVLLNSVAHRLGAAYAAELYHRYKQHQFGAAFKLNHCQQSGSIDSNGFSLILSLSLSPLSLLCFYSEHPQTSHHSSITSHHHPNFPGLIRLFKLYLIYQLLSTSWIELNLLTIILSLKIATLATVFDLVLFWYTMAYGNKITNKMDQFSYGIDNRVDLSTLSPKQRTDHLEVWDYVLVGIYFMVIIVTGIFVSDTYACFLNLN